VLKTIASVSNVFISQGLFAVGLATKSTGHFKRLERFVQGRSIGIKPQGKKNHCRGILNAGETLMGAHNK
jgi:hypothetical protein